MENKKTTLEILRRRAAIYLQREPQVFSASGGRGSKSDQRRIDGIDFSLHAYQLDRFLSRLKQDGDCIVWTGKLTNGGYSCMSIQPFGDRVQGHRLTYRFFIGPVPYGLVLDHVCRNRACVNPDHLRAVTHQENILCGVGATARNAKKTKCDNGHAYTKENTVKTKHGKRCRICRDNDNKYRVVVGYDENRRGIYKCIPAHLRNFAPEVIREAFRRFQYRPPQSFVGTIRWHEGRRKPELIPLKVKK